MDDDQFPPNHVKNAPEYKIDFCLPVSACLQYNSSAKIIISCNRQGNLSKGGQLPPKICHICIASWSAKI